METILIVIHLMIVVALVVVVLLQRSEGGALGIGGGGGGMMSARGAASALTKTTGILAAGFFITSLSLGILARYGSQPTDILDQLPSNQGQQSDGGSLLDQLGGLPANDSGEDGTEAPAADGTGAETPADSGAGSLIPGAGDQSLIPSVNDGPDGSSEADNQDSAIGAEGSLLLDQPSGETAAPTPSEDAGPGQIPANPGESAPNAADPAFIPPVESPSPVEQAPGANGSGNAN